MRYETQHIAERLKDTRHLKGVSQRTLSKLVGVPQAQISRIESGSVDPRLSSLIAIANALDLEITLVPRKALPAVHSIIRQTSGATSSSKKADPPRPAYSLDENDDV